MDNSHNTTASRITDMRQKCKDINLSVSWMDFANRYFQKSSAWFYNKLNGKDENGGQDGFTSEEAELFRNALFDLSERIRRCAEQI